MKNSTKFIEAKSILQEMRDTMQEISKQVKSINSFRETIKL